MNEACKLDLPDIKWDLGRFGKYKSVTTREPAAQGPASAWSR